MKKEEAVDRSIRSAEEKQKGPRTGGGERSDRSPGDGGGGGGGGGWREGVGGDVSPSNRSAIAVVAARRCLSSYR